MKRIHSRMKFAAEMGQDMSWQELERARVEQEISKHYTQISELRSYLNTLSPVAKLLPEILSEVFLNVRDSQVVDERRPNAWAVVASVCWQWRKVALHTVFLWTAVVDLTRVRFGWMKLLLERSRSAPLSLIASDMENANKRATDLALLNIHRFSSIDIPLSPHAEYSLGALWRQALPLLKTASFTNPDERSLTVFNPPRAMPPVFDQCEFPNLQKLYLSGYILSPSSPLFARSLTTLTIDDPVELTIPMLIEILSQTSSLSAFSLSSHFPDLLSMRSPSLAPPKHQVNLPCLKSLFLKMPNDPLGAVSFLALLSLPSQTSFYIDINLPNVTDVSGESFYRGLKSIAWGHNRVESAPEYQTCILNPLELSLSLWNGVYPGEEELIVEWQRIRDAWGREEGLFVKASTVGPHIRALVSNLIELAKRCPLQDVKSLLINDAWGDWWVRAKDVHPPDWDSVCAMMPDVTRIELQVHHQMSHDYYRELFSRILLLSHAGDPNDRLFSGSSGTSSGRQRPVLPCLKKLAIFYMLFNKDSMNALLEVLERRNSSGVAIIERLVLEKCVGIEAEDMDRLRDLVGEVVQFPFTFTTL